MENTKTKTMTTRELLNAIINRAEITDEMIEKAKEMEKALDKKNENRTKKSKENNEKNIALAKEIMKRMENNTFYAVSELFMICEINDIDVANKSKLTAICKSAVEEGLMTSTDDYKVEGKGRKVKGYKVVEQTEE